MKAVMQITEGHAERRNGKKQKEKPTLSAANPEKSSSVGGGNASKELNIPNKRTQTPIPRFENHIP